MIICLIYYMLPNFAPRNIDLNDNTDENSCQVDDEGFYFWQQKCTL